MSISINRVPIVSFTNRTEMRINKASGIVLAAAFAAALRGFFG
jgi:hypothetical protein